MISIAENLMRKEFELLGSVFSVEEMEELNLGIVFDKEDIDEDYGTLVWDCGWSDRTIGGGNAVDIVREWLLYTQGYDEVEDMTADELSDFVNSNYSEFWLKSE